MRSARAVSVKREPSASGRSSLPSASSQMRSASSRALGVEGEEHVERLADARPAQRAERGVGVERGEGALARRRQPLARLIGRPVGAPFANASSAPCQTSPISAGAELGADRRQRLQPQDALGVDRIGVAAQRLDAGDAELARAQLDRRLRRRARRRRATARAVERAREVEIAPAAARAAAPVASARPAPRCGAGSARRRSASRRAFSRG